MVDQVERHVRTVARDTAKRTGLAMAPLAHFLRTGEETWAGAGSGQFSLTEHREGASYRNAAKIALLSLHQGLASLLPEEVRLCAAVPPEVIRHRVERMVLGLVQMDWREVALREIVARTFVLNFRGASDAIKVELTTCDLSGAWQILWAMYRDHGVETPGVVKEFDGVASDYAHIRWPSFHSQDPYSDVVVHEAAHLLHYLKPAHYGLAVRKNQERFVDVDFRHRERFAYSCEAYARACDQRNRRNRIAFAEKMPQDAWTFPAEMMPEIADLVVNAARARSGWRLIKAATAECRR
jgi:hypothetical protein